MARKLGFISLLKLDANLDISVAINHTIYMYKIIISGLVALYMFVGQTAYAQGISIVRDAEIEALVKEYAAPIMRVAGLPPGAIEFHLVNNKTFNAFVTGRDMFLHTGLLLKSEKPGEVIGVIAHEIGHIVGGHQLRLAKQIESARAVAQVSTLLGVGIGALGVATDDEDTASAGFGIIGGGQRAAQRSLLAYQRDEEVSADLAAIKFLEDAMLSGQGMIDTLERLAEQNTLHKNSTDPYLLSHPLPRERIKKLIGTLSKSKYFNKKDDTELQKRHDMIRAKLSAYTAGEKAAKDLFNGDSLHKEARMYGKAIVAHLFESPKIALPIMEELIELDDENPYLHEMKGEILLRSGKGQLAANSFAKAVEMDKHNSGFLRIELGHALLESKNKDNVKVAIAQLKRGLAEDPDTYLGYRHLARAYGEVGDIPHALLASAELAIRTRQTTNAKEYAERAQKGFKKGSPAWLRAEDIIKATEPSDE